jgi:hypothetical protein
MAITYEWSFPNFECDSENKVKTIHWRYTAQIPKLMQKNTYASMYGSCAGSEGMNFDAMTKDHAIMCVTENQSEADMKEGLASQIEAQKNPATVSKTKEF